LPSIDSGPKKDEKGRPDVNLNRPQKKRLLIHAHVIDFWTQKLSKAKNHTGRISVRRWGPILKRKSLIRDRGGRLWNGRRAGSTQEY